MFQGLRYWKDDEPASILLFDKNGWIAGIQTSVPEYVKWVPSPTYLNSYILNETDHENRLTLTVYFVDPKIVCTGRTPKQFAEEGTGTDLYIQNGSNPKTDYQKIPMTQDEIKDTLWGHGKCIYNMGQHFWRGVTKTMNCDDFFPFCLMYNKGRLNAFCFAINANVRPSARYEHPDLGEVKDFIEPVPDCMYSDPSFENTTSLHVYLSENIQLNKC
jgi:charged multivesicular body protein 7